MKDDEHYYVELPAHRKGRGKKPCMIKAGVSLDNDKKVILRAEDQSGVAAMVATLSPGAALQLAQALTRSAEVAA